MPQYLYCSYHFQALQLRLKGIIQKIQIHNTAKVTIITEDNNPTTQIGTIHVMNGIIIAAIKTIIGQIIIDKTTSDNTIMKDVPVNTITIQEITALNHMVETMETNVIIRNDTTIVAPRIIKETIEVSIHIGTDNC